MGDCNPLNDSIKSREGALCKGALATLQVYGASIHPPRPHGKDIDALPLRHACRSGRSCLEALCRDGKRPGIASARRKKERKKRGESDAAAHHRIVGRKEECRGGHSHNHLGKQAGSMRRLHAAPTPTTRRDGFQARAIPRLADMTLPIQAIPIRHNISHGHRRCRHFTPDFLFRATSERGQAEGGEGGETGRDGSRDSLLPQKDIITTELVASRSPADKTQPSRSLVHISYFARRCHLKPRDTRGRAIV